MADQCEATEGELIILIKEALKHEKSKFERRISNTYRPKDLDITFLELNNLAEDVVKGKFGGLRERPKHSIGELSHATTKYDPGKDSNLSLSNPTDEQITSVVGLLRPSSTTGGLQSLA